MTGTYNMVQAGSPEELADLVTVAAGDGSQPIGGPLLLGANSAFPKFLQAMGLGFNLGGGGDGPTDGSIIVVVADTTEPNTVIAQATFGSATIGGTTTTYALAKLVAGTTLTAGGDAIAINAGAGNTNVWSAQAVVTDGVVSLNLGANATVIDTTKQVIVKNSAGTTLATPLVTLANPSVPAVSLDSTDTLVSNGVGLTVPVAGVYVSTITPTVEDGVITGFVLS